MKTHRCSSLPLIWRCTQSQEDSPSGVSINDYSEMAELGTAYHKWIAGHITGKPLEIRQLAEQYAVEADDLSMLVNCGKQLWKQLEPMLTGKVEIERLLTATISGQITLTGQIDLGTSTSEAEIVLDWKTGRVDRDYTAQVRGYALLKLMDAWDENREPEQVTTITAWVRDGVLDVEHFDVADLMAWRDDLILRLKNGKDKYSPGPHCAHCARRLNCPARQELVRSVMAELTVGASPIAWTPETRKELGPLIGDAYGRVKLVEAACEAFREQLKIDIEANGALDIGGGRELRLSPTNRRYLDAGKAIPVLEDFIDPTELLQVTAISISKAEKIAVSKAAKGKGAQVARDLEAALIKADALRTVTSHSLKEGKAK